MTDLKIQGKFYPLTLDIARKLRKAKLTKQEMNLWLYLIELDPYGDRYQNLPPVLEIISELKMSKATYFRCKARLQELELFDFQDEKVSFRNLTGVSKMRLDSQKCDSQPQKYESQKCDSQSQKCDSQSQKCDSQSQKCDSQRSKRASGKASNSSQSISEYSDFIQTLSEAERESFEKFVKEEWKKRKGEDIFSMERFLSSKEDCDNWYQKFSQLDAGKNFKWANYQKREEWLAEIERTGNPAMFADTKEKQDFIKWCFETKQYSWLKEEGK